MTFYRALRPLLFALPPESGHRLALTALRLRLIPPACKAIPETLRVHAFGLDFPGPVGLAAGFDKNAEAIDALLSLGFGFVETGTCTPLPQAGNPQPRLFRLVEDEAVINRMGFNNAGREVYVRNLAARKKQGIVGANIGKNRDAADALLDYLTMLDAVAPVADYVTVNVSSPNTKGLRDLQGREVLSALLSALNARRRDLEKQHARALPLLLKIAPDLSQPEQEDIAEVALAQQVDGVIISNTTIARPESLRSAQREEGGGLSGAPLFAASTEVLANFYRLTQGKLPLIGAGGIRSGADAYAKIRAGATLVQLYSALVYEGFGLTPRIHAELAQLLARDGFRTLKDAVGTANP